MTALTQIPMPVAGDRRLDIPLALELRWSCTAAVCAAALGLDPPRVGVHERVDLAFRLQIVDSRQAFIEARFESSRDSRPLLPRQPASCEIRLDEEMLHIDVSLAGRRLLALSMIHDGRVLYVQTPLLADAGLSGGAYDPPIVHRPAPAHQSVPHLA